MIVKKKRKRSVKEKMKKKKYKPFLNRQTNDTC